MNPETNTNPPVPPEMVLPSVESSPVAATPAEVASTPFEQNFGFSEDALHFAAPVGTEIIQQSSTGANANRGNVLTQKGKDALQLGAMVLSTTIFPLIGIAEGGEAARGAERFLAAEGVLAYSALLAAFGVKAKRLTDSRRSPSR